MWAQIIKTRMKPGAEDEIAKIRDEFVERIRRRPGLIRSVWMRNQKDPSEYYTVIMFESEQQAREGERDIEHDEIFQRIRTITDGTPEYVDLTVIEEIS
ncbi:MAG: hypothetical protein NVS4B2_23340 [Chloroflexota bacterium]